MTTLITKKTKTKSFIAMDSGNRSKADIDTEAQIKHFLAGGGQIQQIPTGVSGEAPVVPGKRVQLNLKSPNKARRKQLAEAAED